jgi:hypothetical protein
LYLGWPVVTHNKRRVKKRARAVKKLKMGRIMTHFKQLPIACTQYFRTDGLTTALAKGAKRETSMSTS